MRRRTALATAAALTLVLLAAAAAVATNLGLLRAGTDTGPVGRLGPADLPPASLDGPAGAAGPAISGGGSDGGQGSAARHDPGDDERSGDEITGDQGRTHQDAGPSPGRFGGRQDDD